MSYRLLLCAAALCAGACAPSNEGGSGRDLTAGGGDDLGIIEGDLFGADLAPFFDVQPSAPQMVTIAPYATMPALTFTATVDGSPVNVAWGVDRGDVATITTGPASTTTFAPRGTAAGVVTVIAGFNGMTVRREVKVRIDGQQNGYNPSVPSQAAQVPTGVPALTAGGGVGGVGGEGLGEQVTDPTVIAQLANPTAGNNLAFIYPYEGTVWPRGLPAPLLQWRWTPGDADAIKIELFTVSGSFSWQGSFGRPAILATTGGKFVRHPIPQDVWEMATQSIAAPTMAGPDKLSVRLTVSRGATASGPITQSWIIAPARLSGTIYYNTYGTQLAKNHGMAVGGDGQFGAAVLSIRVGDAGPKLVAGATGTSAQCRTCHSVAANGARLVTQHGDTTYVSSAYDLTPTGASETAMTNGAIFPAVSPDGTKALSPAGALLPLPGGGTPITSSGLTSVSTSLGTPTFSADGKWIAFNPMAGPGITNPTQKLVFMSFDPVTNVFANPITIVDDTGQPAERRPGWPAFLPDGKSVVFHHQIAAGIDGNAEGDMRTRKGAKAEIAWAAASATTQVTLLNQLNGKDAAGNVYLPKLPAAVSLACTGDGHAVGAMDADHGDDVHLNYEPTVNPVASGGYVWVVFTSRRMYGSVADIPPFCSDPRGVNLITNITPKKLWVAAIDVNSQPGSDTSHPAFYLPGQELLAGNSRGFWVLDPCRPDGSMCSTGDQCCGGYCQPNGPGGALVCSNTNPNAMCSMVQEKCTTSADCCNPKNLCLNGFCVQDGIF
jgi:hypothetical protein